MTTRSEPCSAIDVVRKLVEDFELHSAEFTLVEHFVATNWRVRNPTIGDKLRNIADGLKQHKPYKEVVLRGREILGGQFDPRQYLTSADHVISICSRVQTNGGLFHMAMMNLHPEPGVEYQDLRAILRLVTDDMAGYVLRSGRYFHFYGVALLSESDWHRFLAQFLMPSVIVSPRYIGHCLYRGYTALRLTVNREYKPLLPTVCECLPGGAGLGKGGSGSRPTAGEGMEDAEPAGGAGGL